MQNNNEIEEIVDETIAIRNVGTDEASIELVSIVVILQTQVIYEHCD